MKKLLGMLVTLVLVFSISSTAAFAEVISNDKIMDKVEGTNEFIQMQIDKAYDDAGRFISIYYSQLAANDANLDNEELHNNLITNLTAIGDHLVVITEKKVEILEREAAKDGITIEREYIKVDLGEGVTVEVDPCRVRSE